jgi:nicotinate-nucleotide adenylyltransferase
MAEHPAPLPRVGIFGGTFDPIHLGHLIMAQEVWSHLGLDQVIFVPAGVPPHKQGHAITAAMHRRRMIELAIADDPHFGISTIELEREGPSYTVETLGAFRAKMGDEAGLFFALGGDMLYDIVKWKDPAGIVRLATGIAAFQRPQARFGPEEIAVLEAAVPGLGHAVTPVPTPLIAISSSEIRARVARGAPCRYLVPQAVEAYIRTEGLYNGRAR